MKTVKILTTVIILGIFSQVYAQQESSLLGKWKMKVQGEDGSAIYEFRKEKGKVIGYSIQLIDENGTVTQDNSNVLTKIKFDGKRGKATYSFEWEGERYTIKCILSQKKKGIINVEYSYYGMKFFETWTKIVKE